MSSPFDIHHANPCGFAADGVHARSDVSKSSCVDQSALDSHAALYEPQDFLVAGLQKKLKAFERIRVQGELRSPKWERGGPGGVGIGE